MTVRSALLLALPAGLAVALYLVPAAREAARFRTQVTALAEEAAEMDGTRDVIRTRAARKRALVDDLIAGRVSLAGATGRFLALNRGDPDYMAVIRSDHPGRTDEESQARNLVANVLTALDDPADRARLRARLGGELGEMFPDPARSRRLPAPFPDRR
jgi:hypothetical protein